MVISNEIIYLYQSNFSGQAETIDSPYIKQGKTLDVNVYAKSKKGLGKLFAGILNPFK